LEYWALDEEEGIPLGRNHQETFQAGGKYSILLQGYDLPKLKVLTSEVGGQGGLPPMGDIMPGGGGPLIGP